MFRYFKLELKRFIKITPLVFLMSLVLLVGAAALLLGFKNSLDSDAGRVEFKIGITGDIHNKYFEIGMSALDTVDSSRYSLDISEVNEREAEALLKSGELSAYLIVPEGFVKSAVRGRIIPITFVTLDSDTGLVEIIRDELTSLVESLVLAGQRGVFAIENALEDMAPESLVSGFTEDVTLRFVALGLARDSLYSVEEIGVTNTLGAYFALALALSVSFMLLCGTVYAPTLIKSDLSQSRLMISRGYGIASQIAGEFFSLAVSLFSVMIIVFGVSLYFATGKMGVSLVLALVPAVALVTAFNMLIFEAFDKIVTGVVLQAFLSVFLSYITGCFYPIESLPPILQRISPYLPTGCLRMWIESVFSGEACLERLLWVLAYTTAFLVLTALLRRARVRRL